MTRVELTDKESSILIEVLQITISELKTEIAHTDNREFRQGLKEREAFLEDFLNRLMSSS